MVSFLSENQNRDCFLTRGISRPLPVDILRRAQLTFRGWEKQMGKGRCCSRKWSLSLVAAPEPPWWQALPMALAFWVEFSPGKEPCLFFSSFSPKGLSLPVSLLLGPCCHQRVRFSVNQNDHWGTHVREEGGHPGHPLQCV